MAANKHKQSHVASQLARQQGHADKHCWAQNLFFLLFLLDIIYPYRWSNTLSPGLINAAIISTSWLPCYCNNAYMSVWCWAASLQFDAQLFPRHCGDPALRMQHYAAKSKVGKAPKKRELRLLQKRYTRSKATARDWNAIVVGSGISELYTAVLIPSKVGHADDELQSRGRQLPPGRLRTNLDLFMVFETWLGMFWCEDRMGGVVPLMIQLERRMVDSHTRSGSVWCVAIDWVAVLFGANSEGERSGMDWDGEDWCEDSRRRVGLVWHGARGRMRFCICLMRIDESWRMRFGLWLVGVSTCRLESAVCGIGPRGITSCYTCVATPCKL